MSVLRSKQKVGTTAWVTIAGPVGADLIQRVDLDATNITSGLAFATASVQLVDATEGANSGIKRNAYPVPAPPDPDSSVILLYGFILSAGQSLQVKASAADAVSFGIELQEMAVADA
jgi:hypothetical protein